MESRNLSEFMSPLQRLFVEDDPAAASKTLERSHVEVIERLFAAPLRSDLDGFLDCMTDDVEIEICAPSRFPWKRRAKGREEMRRLVEHNFATVTDQQPTMTQVIAQGHLVVFVAGERGRLRATDETYDVQFVFAFTFRAGKVARVREVVGEASD